LHYDVALFEFHHIASRYASLVRDHQPRAAVIVDSVDLHFARLKAGTSLGVTSDRQAARMYRSELAAYRQADAVIVTSDPDARMLAGETGVPPVYWFPNAVTVHPRATLPRRHDALFVAHFHHAPNLDAVRWLANDIWPGVLRRHEDARLTVIGTYMPAEVSGLAKRPGIEVLGYVPDVQPYLHRAAIALAPLRYGAGMKGKVTDAMAAGVPVVTTAVGAQGLEVTSGEHLMLADETEAFVAAITDLFEDPDRARRIGLAGQRYVAELCATSRVAASLDRLLDETLSRVHADKGRRAEGSTSIAGRVRHWRLASWYAAVSALRKQMTRVAPGSPVTL
jgi:glycosyltransferase involved in cell wall biosynthesis